MGGAAQCNSFLGSVHPYEECFSPGPHGIMEGPGTMQYLAEAILAAAQVGAYMYLLP